MGNLAIQINMARLILQNNYECDMLISVQNFDTIYEPDNNGNVDVIEFLLDFGANLNARTKWGDTPGHYAACFASFEALKFLIEEGVDMKKETPGKFSNRYTY